jgi:hypothetical protein
MLGSVLVARGVKTTIILKLVALGQRYAFLQLLCIVVVNVCDFHSLSSGSSTGSSMTSRWFSVSGEWFSFRTVVCGVFSLHVGKRSTSVGSAIY